MQKNGVEEEEEKKKGSLIYITINKGRDTFISLP
jgi:hypothetical protein